jgi:hypothetical protein
MGHGPVLPPVVAEIQQLVVQVVLGLAGQARIVAVGAGPALRAMAGRTGRHAGSHGVRAQGRRGSLLGLRGRCRKNDGGSGRENGNCPKPRQ